MNSGVLAKDQRELRESQVNGADCRSPLSLKKEKFPSPLLCRDGFENLKQCKQTEMQERSQGVDVSVTTDKKRECY